MAHNQPITVPGIIISLLRSENDLAHMLSLCYAIAAVAHEGQINKDKTPYITHPLRLAARWQTAEQYDKVDRTQGQMVSLLADVLEDTDFTEDMLRSLGISSYIIDTVKLLTIPPSSHCKTLEEHEAHYLYHIQNIINTKNSLAIQTKIFDLEDNMTLTRLSDELDDWSVARTIKYHKAWNMLKEAIE